MGEGGAGSTARSCRLGAGVASSCGTGTGGGATVTLPHEKRLLASLLGMTPENLSRAFASLADYGVTVNGPAVTIGRPVVLERLAKPEPLIDQHLPPDLGAISSADRERWASSGRTRAA